jgi:predicted alpha/beta hydrolase
MAQRLERDIITLVRLAFVLVRVGDKKSALTYAPVQDLRNHGQSPHRRECSYEDLAADVQAFIEQEEKLSDCVVVGHSMCVHSVSLCT